MIKKILFITTIALAGLANAQSVTLNDDANNSIAGKTHYFFDTGVNLAETKLHVSNSSSGAINFDCTVWSIANSTTDNWQVCFGTSCFVAQTSISTAQTFAQATAPAMGSYNDLKIAPFSFGWSGGEWNVLKVKVFDKTNPNDSSTAYVYWQAGGKPAGDTNNNGIIDGGEIAGDKNEDSSIGAGEISGDMNGDGIINEWEVSGDANGNGVIDNGEVLSTEELSSTKILVKSYPNPANDNLTITYSLEGSNNFSIDLYDVLGQKINTYNLLNNKGSLNIDLSNINSGVYFYAVKSGNKTLKTERIIVR